MPSPVYRRCACRRSSPQLAGHAWPWAPSTPPSPFTWTQPLPRRCGLQPCRLWPTSQLLLPTPCNIVHWSFLIMKCTLRMPDPRHWGSQLVGSLLCSRSWSRPLASRCPCAPCAFLQPCSLKKQRMKNHWSTLSFAFVCSELPHCFHHIGAPLLSSRFRNLWYFNRNHYCSWYIVNHTSLSDGASTLAMCLFFCSSSESPMKTSAPRGSSTSSLGKEVANLDLKLTSLVVLSPHPSFRVLQMKDTWEIVRWSVQQDQHDGTPLGRQNLAWLRGIPCERNSNYHSLVWEEQLLALLWEQCSRCSSVLRYIDRCMMYPTNWFECS